MLPDRLFLSYHAKIHRDFNFDSMNMVLKLGFGASVLSINVLLDIFLEKSKYLRRYKIKFSGFI